MTATPTTSQPTIVLVHGAFAESASWNGVIRRLQDHGYTAVAAANPLRSLSGDAEFLSSLLATIEGPVILQVGTALLHLGCVRFGITGPVRYSMTAREAVELCRLVHPRTAIPVHYEGWTHFRQGRVAIERDLAAAPADIRRTFRWLPIGQPATVVA